MIGRLTSIIAILITSTVFAVRRQIKTLHVNTIGNISSRASADSEFRGHTRCGYGRRDIYNNHDSDSVTDPRTASNKKTGYVRGIASRLVMLGRALIETRVMALELPGTLANRLVAATYGIQIAKVPRACFSRLQEMLQRNANRSFEDLKKYSAGLRNYIKHDVRRECVAGNATRRGKKASRGLLALQHGYWSIYEDATKESESIIAARVVDGRRAKQGNREMRQVWHYAKVHIFEILEPAMRAELLKRHISRTEVKRLRRQMVVIGKLEMMRHAQLEFVEITKYRSCVSAQPTDPKSVLEAASEDKFRVTLMFRERRWQKQMRAALKFFHHPLWFFRKKATRTADEWARTEFGHRLGMVLGAVVRVAGIVGLVLGAATCGGGSLATIIADMVGTQMFRLIAYGGVAEFLLNKVILSPIAGVVLADVLTKAEAFLPLQRILGKLDDNEVVLDIRERIKMEVEQIMAKPEIVRQLVAAKADDKSLSQDDAADIEEEVRRYVTGLVYGAFQDEVLPQLKEELDRREQLQDPAFGWLPWSKWTVFRQGFNNGRELKGKQIEYCGPESQAWSGVASVTRTSRKVFGLSKRWLTIVPPDGKEIDVKLTDALKQHLWVHDKVAFRASKAGWLLFHDWTEYRKDASDSALKKKMIYIDRDLRKGECGKLVGKCLQEIMQDTSDTNKGFAVVGTYWKFLGTGDRFIKVKGTNLKSCEHNGFGLTSKVKRCVRVQDSDAYNKWTLDAPRRKNAAAWNEGKVVKVTDEVVKEMCNHYNSDLSEAATKSNLIIGKEFRASSVELEMEAQSKYFGVTRQELDAALEGGIVVGADGLDSKEYAKAELLLQDTFVRSDVCDDGESESESTAVLSQSSILVLLVCIWVSFVTP